MQTFKDLKDREWSIDLTYGNVRRLKKGVDGKSFNLMDDPANLSHQLWGQLDEFYECLWMLVEPQAKLVNLGAEEFSLGLSPKILVEARQKFFEEWKDFFHALQYDAEANALETILSLNQKARALMVTKVQEATGKDFETRAMAKMEEQLNVAFGELQDSLALTQSHTPGVS